MVVYHGKKHDINSDLDHVKNDLNLNGDFSILGGNNIYLNYPGTGKITLNTDIIGEVIEFECQALGLNSNKTGPGDYYSFMIMDYPLPRNYFGWFKDRSGLPVMDYFYVVSENGSVYIDGTGTADFESGVVITAGNEEVRILNSDILMSNEYNIRWLGRTLTYNTTDKTNQRFEFNDTVYMPELQLNNNSIKFEGTGKYDKTILYDVEMNNRFEFNDNIFSDGSFELTEDIGLVSGKSIRFKGLGENVGIGYSTSRDEIQLFGVNTLIEKDLVLWQNKIYFDRDETYSIFLNEVSETFEFSNKVYAPDFETNAEITKTEYIPHFRVTSGTTTNTIIIHEVGGADRYIHNRFTQTTGGTQTGNGHYRFLVPEKATGWYDEEEQTIGLMIRANNTDVDFRATLYINGIPVGNINNYALAVTTANEWYEVFLPIPADEISPGDRVNLMVSITPGANGRNGDLADIKIKYNEVKF